LANELVTKKPFQVAFIGLMFVATIGSLVFLYKSREKNWRAVFATLAGAGLVILGCQDGVYRLSNEWYWSHYYIGIVAALLMIFSLAIAPSIYKDKSHRWRIVHTLLNCIALLLFIGQGLTGTRDLLGIPLSWQEPYIYQCDFANKTCPSPPSKG
jgi:MFS family permease